MKALLLGCLLLLPTTAMSYELDKETLCLAKNIYFEAGIESNRGKMAVAEVTLNRVEAKRWPDTVCGVVYQPKQFSWTLGKQSAIRASKAWQMSLTVAKMAMNGIGLLDIRANHYYAPKAMKPVNHTPFWAEDTLPDFHLEGHVFYFL